LQGRTPGGKHHPKDKDKDKDKDKEMALPKRPDAELGALKALVTVYGTREASRVSGVPYGTISAYAFRYKWKKATFKKEPRRHDGVTGKDAADLLAEALEKHKNASTLNLAKYVDKAAKKAAEHRDPLEVARKVRDVAGVHQVLFPAEEGGEGLIEGAILLGSAKPTINPAEVEARAVEGRVIDDVRTELPDQRPQGD